MRVAVVQMDPQLGRNAENLADIVARLREAASNGAQLVVFPECALSGYGFSNLESARRAAEQVPGLVTEKLAAICAELGVYTVVGLLERDAEAVYNVAILVAPGALLGSYRKLHLPYLGVDRFATPGDRGFQVWHTPLGCIGIAICYDLRFPEALRALALQGAEIIVLPTNWPETSELMPDFVTRTRALENRTYLLACNRVGEESGFRFFGRSQVVGTSGKVMVEADANPGIIYAEINPLRAQEKRIVIREGTFEMDTFADRRPEWYDALLREI